MCGIAGVLDPDWRGSPDGLAELARRMGGRVAHRGPDDEGVWSDPAAGVAFGHRRLAVVDLSDAGHQPMESADGRWVITYNGECYNADELRRALPMRGEYLHGRCDTEVVLEAIAAWGVLPAIQRMDAMFAMALWDRQENCLHLLRDRLGEKPLYYSVEGKRIVFASGLGAIEALPAFNAEVDRSALAMFMRLNYIPAPATIYTSVRKLAAGSMVTVRAGQTGWPDPDKWWDFGEVARSATRRRPAVNSISITRDATDHIAGLLSNSVARRLEADVPVGMFLSGGIDSSLVAALAQNAATRPIRTFTVGFRGTDEDESEHAEAVARHLGTDHTRLELTPADALGLVPELPQWWDEPFADPSQLPTLLLCRQARGHVTVALSGDGGDEIFGGYRRYTAGSTAARWLLPLPVAVRHAGASLMEAIPKSAWDRLGPAAGARMHKLAGAMSANTPRDLYVSLISAWGDAESLVIGLDGRAWQGPPVLDWSTSVVESMMAWDTMTTLPDEMLVKVDRASMAVALEVRPPLLSHRVVEASWALPPNLRVKGGKGKVVLRDILSRHVPRELFERPKTGFDPPLAEWLRGPLRSWAEDLLSPVRLKTQGFFNPAPITARWQELLAGRPGREYSLWSVLMFQSWLEGSAARAGVVSPG